MKAYDQLTPSVLLCYWESSHPRQGCSEDGDSSATLAAAASENTYSHSAPIPPVPKFSQLLRCRSWPCLVSSWAAGVTGKTRNNGSLFLSKLCGWPACFCSPRETDAATLHGTPGCWGQSCCKHFPNILPIHSLLTTDLIFSSPAGTTPRAGRLWRVFPVPPLITFQPLTDHFTALPQFMGEHHHIFFLLKTGPEGLQMTGMV